MKTMASVYQDLIYLTHIATGCRFSRMHQFDSLKRGVDPPVFVSEYAVQGDGGWGNLRVQLIPQRIKD